MLGWAVTTFTSVNDLHAQERKKPQAFLSGGERSAKILEKISEQIGTMDQRIARIEAAVVVETENKKTTTRRK